MLLRSNHRSSQQASEILFSDLDMVRSDADNGDSAFLEHLRLSMTNENGCRLHLYPISLRELVHLR